MGNIPGFKKKKHFYVNKVSKNPLKLQNPKMVLCFLWQCDTLSGDCYPTEIDKFQRADLIPSQHTLSKHISWLTVAEKRSTAMMVTIIILIIRTILW